MNNYKLINKGVTESDSEIFQNGGAEGKLN